MSSAFATRRRYEADQQGRIRAALERIMASDKLSRDTGEMVSRILAA